MAMSKSIRIMEGKSIQIRMDATNIFNHANPSGAAASSGVARVVVPSAPAAVMGNYTGSGEFFGSLRPLGYVDAKVGARTFQAKIRLDF